MNATLHYECGCGQKNDLVTDKWSHVTVPVPDGWIGLSVPGNRYAATCSIECLAKLITAAARLETVGTELSVQIRMGATP